MIKIGRQILYIEYNAELCWSIYGVKEDVLEAGEVISVVRLIQVENVNGQASAGTRFFCVTSVQTFPRNICAKIISGSPNARDFTQMLRGRLSI